ncbi:uncharacterized protein LOC142785209 [Rhipicephalus microplus]|uniref:uncharacterized protein LOC142785209 n=1 Tax=Rhipicephalus microplus TaxID=6941 RepID=UPI003F6C5F67
MEAARDWIGEIASFLTAAGFCGSLFISWHICRARSSASVALSPLVMGLLWTFIWLLYSRETGDALVTRVAAHGYFLTAINVIVHRVFAEVAYSGWQMAVMLPLVYNARLAMGAKQLGQVAFIFSVVCNMVPITLSVPLFPRLHIDLWKIAIFGLWAVYGSLAEDDPLFASSLIGFFAGICQVAARSGLLMPEHFHLRQQQLQLYI